MSLKNKKLKTIKDAQLCLSIRENIYLNWYDQKWGFIAF